MELDMTRGKPVRLLLRFAVPLMALSLLQQVYTLCDSFIVGRLLGTDAFTATASASNLNWFPLNMLLGAIHGFGVPMAQSFGSGKKEDFRSIFAGAVSLSLLLGVLFSVAGVIWAEDLLQLLHTPEQLMDHAVRYIRVLWLGFAVTAVMNVFTTALMALGDSRTPLVALVVSSAVNIALDILFISRLRMDVEGAALATVIAQGAAAAWSFWYLLRGRNSIPRLRNFRPRWRVYRELLRMGVPQLLCNGVTTSGELIVQAAVNSWGLAFVTGLTASHRYLNLLGVVNHGLEGAIATYTGQNWGAKRYDRIERGTRSGIRIGLCASASIGTVVFIVAESMIRFLVPDAAAETVLFGTQALRVQAVFLPALYLLCEYRAAVHGMGNAAVPMFSGFLELAMRIGCTLLLPLLLGEKGLYFTDAAAWVPTMGMLMGCYLLMRKKYLLQRPAGYRS